MWGVSSVPVSAFRLRTGGWNWSVTVKCQTHSRHVAYSLHRWFSATGFKLKQVPPCGILANVNSINRQKLNNNNKKRLSPFEAKVNSSHKGASIYDVSLT